MDNSQASTAYMSNRSKSSTPNFIEGGMVKIETVIPRWERGKISTLGATPLTVRPKKGYTDYYFPWVNDGVGWVKVPYDAPVGTIVTTDGMNGCALQVHRSGDDLYFYHDANSCSMGNIGVKTVGKRIFRVTTDDMVNSKLANKEALDTTPKVAPTKDYNPSRYWFIQLICVRHKTGKWYIVRSSIMHTVKMISSKKERSKKQIIPVRLFDPIRRPGPLPMEYPNFIGELPTNNS